MTSRAELTGIARTLAIGAVAALLASCSTERVTNPTTPPPPPPPPPPPSATVTVLPTSATVEVGASTRLTATVQNAASTAVVWQSSDNGIAVVDGSGNVTGTGVGTAMVSAIAVSGNGASASSTITVTASSTDPCSTTPSTISVPGSVSGALTATDCVDEGRYFDFWRFTLASSTAIVVDLTSSAFDAFLGLVDGAGNVIAVDDDSGGNLNSRIAMTLPAGTYLIAVTSFAAGGTGAYALSVQASTGGSSVSVQVSPGSRSMTVGESAAFQATVSGTSDTRVEWSSSNNGVASVDGGGVVRANGAGTAVIRATSVASPSAYGEATVSVSSGQSSTVEIVVTNSLLNAINISVNGVALGSVPARSTRQAQVQRTSSITLSWSLIRSTTSNGVPVGDVIDGNFQPVTSPGDRLNYTVDAVLGQDFIFRPLIVNQTGTTLLMGVNEGLQSQNRCNCTVPSFSTGTQIGYYRLFSNSNVRGYRDGSGYQGSYIYWQDFAGFVDQSSGHLALTANTSPSAELGQSLQATDAGRILDDLVIPPSDVLDTFGPAPISPAPPKPPGPFSTGATLRSKG